MTRNFTRQEFACKCGCGFDAIEPSLVDDLQNIRDRFGGPLIINSGCRCVTHNENTGGSPASAHLRGMAADIACKSSDERFELVRLCVTIFQRIGIGKDFVHVDIDKDEKSQYIMWLY